MCWRCGNTGGYRSGTIDEDMEKVAMAYAEKDDQMDYFELV